MESKPDSPPELTLMGPENEKGIEGGEFFFNSANFTLCRVKSLACFDEEKGPCKDISFVSNNTEFSPSHPPCLSDVSVSPSNNTVTSSHLGHDSAPVDLARPIDMRLKGHLWADKPLTNGKQSQQRQQSCYSRCGIGGGINEGPLDLSMNSVSDLSDRKFFSPPLI